MTLQDDALAALNDARDDLMLRIIQQTAPPGTKAWQSMMLLVHRRDQLNVEINTIIAAAFNEAAPGLDDAVKTLGVAVTKLTEIQKTLGLINDVVSAVDQIVQIATSVITLAAS